MERTASRPPDSPQLHKILLSRREAAALLSISLRTLDALVLRKELVPRRIGRRSLFQRQALERFAQHDHLTRPNAQGTVPAREVHDGR